MLLCLSYTPLCISYRRQPLLNIFQSLPLADSVALLLDELLRS